ncbi:MAG: hypothetical protein V4772_11375 [Pseudomonadota bacterium]
MKGKIAVVTGAAQGIGAAVALALGRREANTPHPAAWLPYLDGKLDCMEIDCNHFGMSDPEPMAAIGRELAKRLGISPTDSERSFA